MLSLENTKNVPPKIPKPRGDSKAASLQLHTTFSLGIEDFARNIFRPKGSILFLEPWMVMVYWTNPYLGNFLKCVMSPLELTDFFEVVLVYWLNIYLLIYLQAILFIWYIWSHYELSGNYPKHENPNRWSFMRKMGNLRGTEVGL